MRVDAAGEQRACYVDQREWRKELPLGDIFFDTSSKKAGLDGVGRVDDRDAGLPVLEPKSPKFLQQRRAVGAFGQFAQARQHVFDNPGRLYLFPHVFPAKTVYGFPLGSITTAAIAITGP